MVQDYRQPRTYELMTVLIPDLDDEQTSVEVDRVQGIVSASGQIAASLQTSPWGRRRLAYTIRHNGVDYRDGYYLLTYFTAMPDSTAELERELRLNAQVMRYLLVQSEPYVAPEVETAEEPEGETAAAAPQPAEGDAEPQTARAEPAAEPAEQTAAGDGEESAAPAAPDDEATGEG